MKIANLAKLLVVSSVIVFTGCANYTSVREHANIHESARDIESVVIVPPSVNVELKVFTGENESMPEKEEQLRSALLSLAASRLAAEGLEVIEFNFQRAIEEDEEFAFAITQAKEALDTAEQDLYTGKAVTVETKAQFEVSLGPVVNAIAERTGAESVLLMDYYGFEKSAGLQTKDIAAGVLLAVLLGSSNASIAAPSGSFVDVALIDTSSGDVLWANRKGGQVLNSQIVEMALAELPDVVWENEVVVAADTEGQASVESPMGVTQ
jgi:hypothetical protein